MNQNRVKEVFQKGVACFGIGWLTSEGVVEQHFHLVYQKTPSAVVAQVEGAAEVPLGTPHPHEDDQCPKRSEVREAVMRGLASGAVAAQCSQTR